MISGRRLSSATLLLLLMMAAPAPVQGLDRSEIEAALNHPNLRGALLGVEIRSLHSGEVLFARQPHTPLIIASNTKLFTTASALHHLGVDYAFSTEVHARGDVEDGVLRGDLIIRGGGDPCLSDRFHETDPLAPLDTLARFVSDAGIREIAGRLVLDDTLFDREYVAPGWPKDQLNRYYCAPVSALSYMENLVRVQVTPAPNPGSAARVDLHPEGSHLSVSGRVLTTDHKNENLIHIARPDPDGRIQISGRTSVRNPSSSFTVAVRNPAAYAGSLFLGALRRAGVHLHGDVVLAEDPPDYEAGCTLLGSVRSDLLQAVILTNKKSLNHFAEQLFKLSGWKAAGKGSFASGELAVRMLFRDLGIRDADPFTMVDGSGLSRSNTFSAHTLVSLLAAVYGSPCRDAFIRSLPIAGVDGSLKHRLTEEPFASRVRGKTGWIREVSALSGYVQSLSGDVCAFSILFNGYRGSNAVMKSIQDRICRAMVKN